jgi:hypothetical protein
MYTRLTAEESLLMRERVAIGTGAYGADDARRIVNRWQQQMAGESAARPVIAKATPADLAALGIEVVVHHG